MGNTHNPSGQQGLSTRHTPGPWTTEGQWKLKAHVAGIFKRGEGYSYHCRTLAYVGPNPQHKNDEQLAEAQANACLISAAPDLLAALLAEELRRTKQPNPFGHDCNWCGICVDTVDKMRRDAIAKAEGR